MFDCEQDDVNTVTYADETCHLIFSGSDDHTCKVGLPRCLISRFGILVLCILLVPVGLG